MGPLLWTLGLVCIGLAAWFEYYEHVRPGAAGEGHWSIGQAVAMWLGLGALWAAVTAHAHLGSRDHLRGGGAKAAADAVEDEDGGAYLGSDATKHERPLMAE